MRNAFFTPHSATIFQHSGIEPLFDVSQHAPVRNPVLDKLHQPLMVDGIKIATNVCIQHPAYLSRHDSGIKGVERIMWTASRPKTIRKTDKVSLVDRTEHLNRCSLDDLVFQGSYPNRPLATIGFGNKCPLDWLCSIRPAPQPISEIRKILLEVLAIVPPCLTVDPWSRIALECIVGAAKVFDVVDMVPERGKLQLPILDSCMSYPFQRIWQVVRAAFHCNPLPGTAPRTCFARTDSPWSGPFPPQPPPMGVAPTFVRPLPRYLWACPTSHNRSSLSYSLGIHSTDPSTIAPGPVVRPPGSRTKGFGACTGSTTTQGQTASRAIETARVAFRLFRHRRHPEVDSLPRLNTRPALSPVNASHTSSRTHAHDSGPLWSAKPSTCGTLIHYPLPVLTGATET